MASHILGDALDACSISNFRFFKVGNDVIKRERFRFIGAPIDQVTDFLWTITNEILSLEEFNNVHSILDYIISFHQIYFIGPPS